MKVCANRATAQNPNVYQKHELQELALRRLGITYKMSQKMSKEYLCARLKIPWKIKSVKTVKKVVKKKNISDIAWTKCKPANYSKNDLVKVATKCLGLPTSHAQAMTKVQLCNEIEKIKRSKFRQKVSDFKKPSGDCITRSQIPLKPHQLQIINYLKKNRGVVAVHSVGSGKTLLAVAASQCIIDNDPTIHVLVVTPKTLQENFKKELRAYRIGINSDLPNYIYDEAYKEDNSRYTFITKNKFANDYLGKPGKCSDIFLIIDEAHNFKNKLGKGARAAFDCTRRAKKVLLLTATPVYNAPEDLISLVTMIKGPKYNISKKILESYITSINPNKFNEYFNCVFSFYDNPKTDFPEVKERFVNIPMNKGYYNMYLDVERLKSAEFADPYRFLMGVRQATNAFPDSDKVRWSIKKIIESVDKGKKTLLYSAFLGHGINKIKEELYKNKIKFVEITGALTEEERNSAVKKFNSTSKTAPYVLLITKAGGEGLDLKNVETVILLEAGYNRSGEKQVIGRAARYKSHIGMPEERRKVDVWKLVLIKPKGWEDFERFTLRRNNPRNSADVILRQIIEEKEKSEKIVLARLKNMSIDSPQNEKCW
ncbi:helicase-related protein [bacterium]|nr:helicase-related protein [bacterium]